MKKQNNNLAYVIAAVVVLAILIVGLVPSMTGNATWWTQNKWPNHVQDIEFDYVQDLDDSNFSLIVLLVPQKYLTQRYIIEISSYISTQDNWGIGNPSSSYSVYRGNDANCINGIGTTPQDCWVNSLVVFPVEQEMAYGEVNVKIYNSRGILVATGITGGHYDNNMPGGWTRNPIYHGADDFKSAII